jgi:glycosyltransferase involved in cell wall biosynthesis
MISVVVLTFNSEKSIERTLRSIRQISDDIHVVDSFSADRTVEICRSAGCSVTQRAFKHYANQRNWAMDNLSLRYDWQMHVDADEELELPLVERLRALDLAATDCDGFIFGRKVVFLGKVLRFGAIGRTWHCRLFRTGLGRCEDRHYDQHFVCTGKTAVIDAFMLDHQEGTLSEWTARHNRWSDLEAAEVAGGSVSSAGVQIEPRADGNAIERKRHKKQLYYRLPLFWRAFAYFLFSYLVRLGFLDGAEGLVYQVLQALWFRFLVDAKLYERRISIAKTAPDGGLG